MRRRWLWATVALTALLTPGVAAADPLSAAIVSALSTIGITTTIAAVNSFLITTALTVGANLAASMLRGKPRVEAQERQASVASLSVGEHPREVIYGRALTAGSLLDAGNFGGQHRTDWEVLCIALADHSLDALEGFYVNDEYHPYTTDGGQPAFSNALDIEFVDASDATHRPPARFAGANWLGRSGSDWADTDKLNGMSVVWVAYQAVESVWTSGRPTFKFVVRGKRLYDPRKDSTVGGAGAHRWADRATHEWSENASLIAYDYCRGTYVEGRQGQKQDLLVGMGLSHDEAGGDLIFAHANLCDEVVDSAARYRIGGVVRADEAAAEVLDMMAAAMGGVIVQPQGGVTVEPGAGRTPVATITDGDLIVGEEVLFSDLLPAGERVNTVVPRYVEPSQIWTDHAAPVRRNVADVLADGGSFEEELSLALVNNGAQAQRVGEIALRLHRLERRASLALGPRFCRLEAGDWIAWQSDRYLNGGTAHFRIEATQLGADWRSRLSLREIEAAVYGGAVLVTDTAATSTVTQPDIPTPTEDEWSAFVPQPVAGQSYEPAAVAEGVVGALGVDGVVFEFRRQGEPGWTTLGVDPPTLTRKVIPLTPDPAMDLGVRYQRGGRLGPRLSLLTDVVIPAAVAATSVNTLKVGGRPSEDVLDTLDRADTLLETLPDLEGIGGAREAAELAAETAAGYAQDVETIRDALQTYGDEVVEQGVAIYQASGRAVGASLRPTFDIRSAWTIDTQTREAAALPDDYLGFSQSEVGATFLADAAAVPIGPRGVFVPVSGRTYELTVRDRVARTPTDGRVPSTFVGYVYQRANGTIDVAGTFAASTQPQGAFRDATFRWTPPAGIVWARPYAHLNTHPATSSQTNGAIELWLFQHEDITESLAAEAAANAASGSAGAASGSAGAAAGSAGAAAGSAGAASGSAGVASGHATTASNKAGEAATSAFNANASAGQASGAADRSEAEADRSGTEADRAEDEADRSGAEADRSKGEADRADGQADRSKDEADRAADRAQVAQDARDAAIEAAGNAQDHETASRGYSEAAAGAVTTAGGHATNAQNAAAATQTTELNVYSVARFTLPAGIDSLGRFFTNDDPGNALATPPRLLGSDPAQPHSSFRLVLTERGRAFEADAAVSFMAAGYVVLRPGRRHLVSAVHRVVFNGVRPVSLPLGLALYGADGSFLTYHWFGFYGPRAAADGWTSERPAEGVTTEALRTVTPSAVYARPILALGWNAQGATLARVQVAALAYEDVSESAAAQGSAQAANTAASTATTAADAAGISATAANLSNVSAFAVARQSLPSAIDLTGRFFTNFYQDNVLVPTNTGLPGNNPETPHPQFRLVTTQRGRTFEADAYVEVTTSGFITLKPGRAHKVTVLHRVLTAGSGPVSLPIGLALYDQSGAFLDFKWLTFTGGRTPASGWVSDYGPAEGENAPLVTSEAIWADFAAAVFARPLVVLNYLAANGSNAGARVQLAALLYEDVSEAGRAAGFAKASQDSYELAQAAVTDAGDFAEAASGERQLAETARGAAETLIENSVTAFTGPGGYLAQASSLVSQAAGSATEAARGAAAGFTNKLETPVLWTADVTTEQPDGFTFGDDRFLEFEVGKVFVSRAGDNQALAPRASFVPRAGRRYRLTVWLRLTQPPTNGSSLTYVNLAFYAQVAGGSPQYFAGQQFTFRPQPYQDGTVGGDLGAYYDRSIEWEAPAYGLSWARPVMDMNIGAVAGARFEVKSFLFEDITAQADAALSAGEARNIKSDIVSIKDDIDDAVVEAAGYAERSSRYNASSNLLENADFRVPTAADGFVPAGWVAYTATLANYLWRRTGGGATSGLIFWDWLPASLYGFFVQQNASNPGVDEFYLYNETFVEVEAGQFYEGSCYLGAHNCTVWVAIEWSNAGGVLRRTNPALYAESHGDAAQDNAAVRNGGQELASFIRCWARGKAPAGATRARLLIIKGDSWIAGATYMFGCLAQLGRTDQYATSPAPWRTGTNGKAVADTFSRLLTEEQARSTAVGGLATRATLAEARASSENEVQNSAFAKLGTTVNVPSQSFSVPDGWGVSTTRSWHVYGLNLFGYDVVDTYGSSREPVVFFYPQSGPSPGQGTPVAGDTATFYAPNWSMTSPGEWCEASVYMATHQAIRVYVVVEWTNSQGQVVSTSVAAHATGGGYGGQGLLQNFTRIGGRVQAPPGARYRRIILQCTMDANAPYALALLLRPMLSAAPGPKPTDLPLVAYQRGPEQDLAATVLVQQNAIVDLQGQTAKASFDVVAQATGASPALLRIVSQNLGPGNTATSEIALIAQRLILALITGAERRTVMEIIAGMTIFRTPVVFQVGGNRLIIAGFDQPRDWVLWYGTSAYEPQVAAQNNCIWCLTSDGRLLQRNNTPLSRFDANRFTEGRSITSAGWTDLISFTLWDVPNPAHLRVDGGFLWGDQRPTLQPNPGTSGAHGEIEFYEYVPGVGIRIIVRLEFTIRVYSGTDPEGFNAYSFSSHAAGWNGGAAYGGGVIYGLRARCTDVNAIGNLQAYLNLSVAGSAPA